MDINKVKSKSRAILNLKKDGEKLEQADEDFMKEIYKQTVFPGRSYQNELGRKAELENKTADGL